MPNEKEKLQDYFTKAMDRKDDLATGFMARSLVQATMPHSKPKENYYIRQNGKYSLTMYGHPQYGIPYGTIPRLLMSWITTEAVKKKSPQIDLGYSLRSFMNDLGFNSSTGGKNGSITSLKDQMKRLFTCSISCVTDTDNHFAVNTFQPIYRANLWWDVRDIEQVSLFMSSITLNTDFYNEIIASPVVYRLSTLKLLKQSSMAIDLYIWITYRNSYAKKTAWIRWEQLQEQFGSSYPNNSQGCRNFKKKFITTLKKVAIAYPDASKLRPETDHLIFIPGRPDVPKLTIVT